MVVNLIIFSLSSNEKNVPQKQIKSRRRQDNSWILIFLGSILSRRSFSRTMLITLLKLKCVRKSEDLKVKDSKCSGWNKFTMTLNESVCIILTKKISSLKVHELNLYLVRHGIVFKGKKSEKVACIKAHIAKRILSGMEKGTPLCEETLTLGSESDVEERIVGSEISSTLSSELSDISQRHPMSIFQKYLLRRLFEI